VKLPDVNLLLYALDETAVHHGRARQWLEDVLSGTEPVGFAWSVLLAFLRLSTRPQIFASPFDPAAAQAMLVSESASLGRQWDP
jgi:predicted nucleic acid-binding protein